ncbi:prepilin-type N-terminal cleavage/methylation domain-containing protein [bacterium]|nr:prepilin-type N-terminal cleavage/methylation domain-containing protein [bacterium]
MKKSKTKKTKKGFTLIEVIVAVFIFALMASAASGIFVKMIKSYRYAKVVQRDLESAQYAMNLMAKTLRTSSVANCSSGPTCPGTSAWIRVFDYSRSECRMYSFNDNRLEERVPVPSIAATGPSDCSGGIYGGSALSKSLTTGNVSGSFDVDVTANGVQMGKVTISMTINSGDRDTNMQSSVSLRDYSEAGI